MDAPVADLVAAINAHPGGWWPGGGGRCAVVGYLLLWRGECCCCRDVLRGRPGGGNQRTPGWVVAGRGGVVRRGGLPAAVAG